MNIIKRLIASIFIFIIMAVITGFVLLGFCCFLFRCKVLAGSLYAAWMLLSALPAYIISGELDTEGMRDKLISIWPVK
jgi:hypothetical protein